jgi:O-antigen ligase
MKKINFYLIVGICFLLPSYLVRFSLFGVPMTMLEILIYVSVIITLIQNSIIKSPIDKYKIKKSYIWIPVILFMVSGIIGILVSPDKTIALGQFKGFILVPILFFWTLTENIKNRDELMALLYGLIFSGVYVATYSMWQKISGQITPDGRVIGIFNYSPNYLVFYMVPITLILFFVFYFEKSKVWFIRFFKVVLLIVFLYSIYLSGSRAAIVAFLGAIALTYFFKHLVNLKAKIYIKTMIVVLLIVIAGLLGFNYFKPDYSLSVYDGGRTVSSDNIRWEIWRTTVYDILPQNYNWLWGVGLGMYQDYFSDLTKERVNFPQWVSPLALTPHNLFLQIWVNMGMLGLISFTWILYIFFSKINLSQKIGFIVCVVMVAILIQGIVDAQYWKNDLAVMFWMLVALSILCNNFLKKEDYA